MVSKNKEEYLKLPQNIAIRLSILRGFEFVSQLRRASVLVSQAGDKDVNVYVKGAPECMKDICRAESCKSMRTSAALDKRMLS